MVSTVLSAALTGISAELVRVEADVSNGLPMFHMVGYLSSEVKEAADRVRSAIRNADLLLPIKHIVVNLSPADVRKRGTAFDLPIAAAVLTSVSLLKEHVFDGMLLVGELGLDGSVHGLAGILPIVIAAKKQGIHTCIIPKDNREEGELVEGIRIIGIAHLRELYDWALEGCPDIPGVKSKKNQLQESKNTLDFSDVRGQKILKRAVEIAVAGEHHLLMVGPPGVGKSMIAKRIPTILPPLTMDESMELTMLYSIAGELDKDYPLVCKRPYREVDHSVTRASLLGGGMYPRPGEISLADYGVLFLDELPEFPRQLLESLRQPIENDKIRIIRGGREYEFPSRFLLVAAMNPCPCGNYPDLNRCNCTKHQIDSYRGKLSQPLLDRFDLCVEAEKIPYQQLSANDDTESSAKIQSRVIMARKTQKERYRELDITTNGRLSPKMIHQFCKLDTASEKLMEGAFEKWNLTARTYHKTLKVARTIADLAESPEILKEHLMEAFAYRPLEETENGGGTYGV